jgi:molybdopterin-containing oxidoreductase family membrane subunit
MTKTSGLFKVSVVVLAALALAGIGAWIYQLIGGLGVTGMNNGTSWGLYIACFMLFVGLSAGGLIVASAASVFHIADYKKVAMPAIILSTVCICLAGVFVLIDMGGVHRVLNIIIHPNITSPLFWDVCIISIYLIINIFYLAFMRSKNSDSEAGAKRLAILSRIALPAAILVHSVTAWIFGLEIAREGWYSAIMAPLFVVSAMDSGLALLLLTLVGLNKSGVFKTEKALISKLAVLLMTCVAIDFFLICCELLTMAYPGAGGAETLSIMAMGATAPFFWFELVAGLVIPFLLLSFAALREKIGVVVLASILVVIGVFCKRIWLLLTSFVEFNVQGAPGVISGSTAAANATSGSTFALASSYVPTWVEITVVVGFIALGALAFMVMTRALLATSDVKETETCADKVKEAAQVTA